MIFNRELLLIFQNNTGFALERRRYGVGGLQTLNGLHAPVGTGTDFGFFALQLSNSHDYSELRVQK